MADNPFMVTPANPLQGLMLGQQSYDRSRGIAKEDAMMEGRKKAVQIMAAGGDPRQVYGALMEVGDMQGAQGIASMTHQQAQEKLAQAQLAESSRHNRAAEGVAGGELQLKQEAAKEKPTIVWQENANGDKVPYLQDPKNQTTPIRPLDAGQPTQAGNPFSTGAMKEHEGKSALFADRAATAHQVITKFEKLNREPGGTIGATMEKTLPEGVSNVLVSGERGQLMNGKRAFINALLRRESGAAIAAGEFTSYDKEYFPQLGDTDAQINAKRMHRAEVIKGLAREAGKHYRPGYSLDEQSGFVIRGKPKDQAQVPTQSAQAPQGVVDYRAYFGGQ